jgi:selenocysteine lyase/cysteine desulfurase
VIYLDYAATSLLKPVAVERAVTRALRTMASPGRGSHEPAMQAADTVFRCREAAARLFHMQEPERVVFTMNATHALNIAIRSLAAEGSRVLISGFEHNAVTRPLHALGARLRIAGRKLFDPEDTLRSFAAAIPGCDLAVCTAVSNVFGYRLPLEEIAALCRREGVPLIVDASQAAGVLDLDFPGLGAAFMAMPGHKGLLGPQGTGLLLCAAEAKPLLYGGSGSESREQDMPDALPDRLEAGTHNVCGIAGLLAGIAYVSARGTEDILRHERALLHQSLRILAGADCELFAGDPGDQTGVLSLRSCRLDCEILAARLGERGICVRSGLHCAPLAHESAGTLESGTLRLSFSPLLDGYSVSKACITLRQLLGGDS